MSCENSQLSLVKPHTTIQLSSIYSLTSEVKQSEIPGQKNVTGYPVTCMKSCLMQSDSEKQELVI